MIFLNSSGRIRRISAFSYRGPSSITNHCLQPPRLRQLDYLGQLRGSEIVKQIGKETLTIF